MSRPFPPPSTYRCQLVNATGPVTYTDLYLDVIWCPIIGPTIISLLRALTTTLKQTPTPATLAVNDIAAMIGVAPTRASEAITRAANHGLLQLTVDGTLEVPDGFPLAPPKRTQHLTSSWHSALHLLETRITEA